MHERSFEIWPYNRVKAATATGAADTVAPVVRRVALRVTATSPESVTSAECEGESGGINSGVQSTVSS